MDVSSPLLSPETGEDDPVVALLRRGFEQQKFRISTQWIQPCPTLIEEGRAFEVLLRLEDEDGFWAEAISFMGMAERCRLAGSLDRWVIRQSLDFLTLRPQLAQPVAWFGLNLSRQTLCEPDLPEFLVQQLVARRSLAGKLCFEVWENDLLHNDMNPHTFCTTVQRLGCRVAVQGFRARDADEISLLSKLPLNFVKMEAQRYPLRDNNPAVRELAQSCVRIARLQNARVIVTGVEDAATLDAWRRLGVDYFQGYAVARPTPVTFSEPH